MKLTKQQLAYQRAYYEKTKEKRKKDYLDAKNRLKKLKKAL